MLNFKQIIDFCLFFQYFWEPVCFNKFDWHRLLVNLRDSKESCLNDYLVAELRKKWIPKLFILEKLVWIFKYFVLIYFFLSLNFLLNI